MSKKFSLVDVEEKLLSTGKNIRLIGEFTNVRTKTIFECINGHRWEAKPYKIFGGSWGTGTDCPFCNTINKSFNSTIFTNLLTENQRDVELVGDYVNAKSKTLFKCSKNHEWFTTPDSIMRGSGCPVCVCRDSGFDIEQPAWTYVILFEEFIKFGVTNNLNRRMNEHKKSGEFTLVYSKYYEVGQLAIEWENNIKRLHGGRYVTKEKCPSGYTETLPPHLLETITR